MKKKKNEKEVIIEEKESDLVKGIVYAVVAVLLIALVVVLIETNNNKKEEEKEIPTPVQEVPNNKEQVKRPSGLTRSMFVLDNINNTYLLDENHNILWKHTNEDRKMKSISIDGDYLYYPENDTLKRLNINTMNEEVVSDITLGTMPFFVKDDYLVFGENSLLITKKDDVKKEIAKIACNPEESHLLDHSIYCVLSKELTEFDLKTATKKVIEENVKKIIYASNNWILYTIQNEDKTIYKMYNVYSRERKEVPIQKSNNTVYLENDIKIFENNVYYGEGNTIFKIEGNEPKEYYTFNPQGEEIQKVTRYRALPNSKLLLDVTTYLPCNCEMCICDNYYSTLYLVDVNTGEIKEANKDIYGFDSEFGLGSIYYFYE